MTESSQQSNGQFDRTAGLSIDAQVDARNLDCPMPLLKAKQAINRLKSEQTVRVVCTDSASQRDFSVFAQQSGHALLRVQIHELDDGSSEYEYVFQKR